MKKTIILITTICLVVMLPVLADSSEKKVNKLDAKVKFGLGYIGKEDATVKVKEYSPLDDGIKPFLKAVFSGNLNKTFFNVISKFYGDSKDMSHKLKFDFNRVLKQELEFNSLYHRLDHDPLKNIDVVSEKRSAAYATDFNPDEQYYMKRTEFVSKTQFSVPMVPGLKFYVHYRDEKRNGMYQARTLSKCSACHVVAKSRSINNYNKDIKIGANIRFGKSTVDYSYTANEFKERSMAPTNDYILVIHPEKLKKVFTSRISVGDKETLAFDVIPKTKKDTHLLQAAIPFSNYNTLSGQFVSSRVENLSSKLKWKSNAFSGAYSARLGKKGFFNAILFYQSIDNDSVFIDINDKVDVGGPNKGKTYAEILGLDTFDWTRKSSLSRKVFNLKANVRYKLSKKLKLRLGYIYESIDRDFFEVGNTKSNTVKGRLTFKPAPKFKLVFDAKIKSISDPFANLKGGIAQNVQMINAKSPLSPKSVQFMKWHQMRTGTMTNYPESVKEFKGRFHWGPSSKFALNGNFLYRKEDNDNLVTTGASWNRDLFQWGADIWTRLGEKVSMSLSYYDYKNVYSTLFANPVIEGCGGGIIVGMPGTLTDMMDLDNTNQTLLFNLSYWASDKFSVFFNINYNKSGSVIKNLELDESQMSFLPGTGSIALDFDNMGQIADYSKLDMNQVITHIGMNLALSKSWTLNGSVYYYIVDDIAKYLFTDTSGKSYSIYVGVTWQK